MTRVDGKLPSPTEHQEQAALFAWARVMTGQHPCLALLFAVPNGGLRTKATAGKLRAEGVQAGVPDVWLPVPRGGYHGLVIEMKRAKPKGRLTVEQMEWIEALQEVGWRVAICYGFDDARKAIERYLELAG